MKSDLDKNCCRPFLVIRALLFANDRLSLQIYCNSDAKKFTMFNCYKFIVKHDYENILEPSKKTSQKTEVPTRTDITSN